jgi:hypothetical protein
MAMNVRRIVTDHDANLIDAKPVEVNGKEIRTFFPVPDGSQKAEV